MNKLVLLCAAAAGCVDPELYSSTSDDVSKSTLTSGGAHCEDISPEESMCSQCSTVTTHDAGGTHQVTVCSSYYCIGTSCTYRGSYIPDATYAADLNYWFEAEQGVLTSPMVTASDSQASGGAFVTNSTTGGSISFSFTAPIDSNVVGWMRVIAPSPAAVSLQLDGFAPQTSTMPAAATWTWLRVENLQWWVPAGPHTIRVTAGSPGLYIDRLVLTDNSGFVPVVATIQAETAALVAPMQIGSVGPLYAQTRYIWVPNGAGTGGLAQLATPVPYAASYGVWGRFNAPTTADNAFDLGADYLSTRTTWNIPVTSSGGWTWNRAPSTYALSASSTLDLFQHDDGTKLDKIVVTDDPGFTLIEPPPIGYSL